MASAAVGSQIAPSLAELLSQTIDYAGLFPPAKLPMEPAIQNYASYRPSADAWMLARFVVQAQKLPELAAIGDSYFSVGPPFQFSLLGQSGATREEYLDNLSSDLNCVNAFRNQFGSRVETDVFEIRLPNDVLSSDVSVAQLSEFLKTVSMNVESQIGSSAVLFHEVPLAGKDFRAILEKVAAAAAAVPAQNATALKIRTGGLEAAAFPSSEKLAAWIAICARHNVSWKATAGLHHPVRRFDKTVNAKMYGFLNVIGAAVIEQVHKLDESKLQAILEDELPESFTFDGDLFCWRAYCADKNQIAAARKRFAVSFGSCSFDEPRDDLRELGYL